jgi:translation initiation factor IF-1
MRSASSPSRRKGKSTPRFSRCWVTADSRPWYVSPPARSAEGKKGKKGTRANQNLQCFDGVKRLGLIRGKLRKKIWINNGDIILVSLREYQDEKGDVILKYNADEARSLYAPPRITPLPLPSITNPPPGKPTASSPTQPRSTRPTPSAATRTATAASSSTRTATPRTRPTAPPPARRLRSTTFKGRVLLRTHPQGREPPFLSPAPPSSPGGPAGARKAKNCLLSQTLGYASKVPRQLVDISSLWW